MEEPAGRSLTMEKKGQETTKDTKYHEGFVQGSFVRLSVLRGKGFELSRDRTAA
jgi:hypothetical protein